MGLIDILFPVTCLECRREGKYICPDCLIKTRILPQVCPYCERQSVDGFTHSKCHKKLGLDDLTSLWKYEGVIKKAILSLKFKHAFEVGYELSEMFSSFLLKNDLYIPPEAVLIPIPMFWYKENVRGFNQAALIGKSVSLALKLSFNELLIKTRQTVPQVDLGLNERKKNTIGVFEILPSKISKNNQNILLFDDVFTSGSTLREACKVLKRAGFENVWGLTVAR